MRHLFKLIKAIFSKKVKKNVEALEKTTTEAVTEVVEEVKKEIMKTITCTRNLTNVLNYTNKFKESVEKAETATGIPAIVMLAQVALETGWGNKILELTKEDGTVIDSRNLFNIKSIQSWTGEKGYKTVPEYLNNQWVDKKEYFKIYPTYEASFKDYAKLLLENSRYAEAAKNKDNPEKFVDEMAKAGYATDPKYAKKIKQIMRINWKYV